MPSNKNTAVVAAAGSGKTRGIVTDALQHGDKPILITTYTHENIRNIEVEFIRQVGHVPPNVVIQPWYQFLLREGVRPYQNSMNQKKRIESINFLGKRIPSANKTQLNYYLDSKSNIYRDAVSDFVVQCNMKSFGLVVARLSEIYDVIFVDELQDMAGYDLEILELLLDSAISIHMVGDPRQATFITNRSGKNRGFRRAGISTWLSNMETAGKLVIEEKCESYRCNQVICDFADDIYPEMPKTVSKSTKKTSHDGVFEIALVDLDDYMLKHKPVVLRYNIKTNTQDYAAKNIGASKGQTFDRVLIFPTKPMKAYLTSKNPDEAGDRSKLYVAVTRARYSVAFVVG